MTEPEHFCGSLEDLAAVREAVDLPILRKDFVTTPYQVVQARAFGADLILLIVAGLEDDPLKRLYEEALKHGLEVLVECHDEAELERAIQLGSPLLGINSRNLKTLEVDLTVTERLLPQVPDNFHAIAESGVKTVADAQRMAAAGARGLLVGTALIDSEDPAVLLQELQRGLNGPVLEST